MSPIQTEMETVFERLKNLLRADAGKLLDGYLPVFGIDPAVPPAFVLFSARLFGDTASAILPALFMVFIHLAITLHNLPQQIDGRDRQLVILEGDYLYAHLFLLLCRENLLNLLDRFSRLIREMNEGAVMRRLQDHGGPIPMNGCMAEILEKQYGLYFAECCELGGLFAGGQRDEVGLLRRFGDEFGVAYGAKEAGLGPDICQPLLDRALASLAALAPVAGRDELAALARDLIMSAGCGRFRMAV